MVRFLDLNAIQDSANFHLGKWSHGLESNKAGRILHYLILRLWESERGHLVKARFTFAQASLSKKLGISRQWINVLCKRLVAKGWLRYETTKLSDGTNSSCVWKIGPQLKRLLVTLQKSKNKKSLTTPMFNNRLHIDSSSFRREKEKENSRREIRFASHIREEKEESYSLKTEILSRMPTLADWLQRGENKS